MSVIIFTKRDLTLITRNRTEKGNGYMMNLIGLDGKPINKPNPMEMGIEDLIKIQEITKGRGTTLTMDEILTVVIFELTRVKKLAIELNSEVVRLQKELDGEDV